MATTDPLSRAEERQAGEDSERRNVTAWCSLRTLVLLSIVSVGVVCAGITVLVVELQGKHNTPSPSPSPSLPCPSSRTFTAVGFANAMYALNDTGVLMHFNDGEEDPVKPWLARMGNEVGNVTTRNRLSFLILNHFAVKRSEVNLFLGADELWGIIGMEHVTTNLTTCLFPKDGFTNWRKNEGCGCAISFGQTCHQPNHSNWCDGNQPNRTGGHTCAYHPSQLPEMMKHWSQIEMKECNASDAGDKYGIGGKAIYCFNEAIVDGAKWNHDVDKNLQAFVLPTGRNAKCGPETDCFKKFTEVYKNYAKAHGDKPILGLDVTAVDQPFQAFVPHDQTCESLSEDSSLLVI